MRKFTLVAVMLLCTASLLLHAGGRKDNESHDVDSLEGFNESINIERKKTGKWNVFVAAQDRGGNTTIAGPHNIFIDPESDLPVTRIINPQPNMHIQGNLNIVGTCIDDDGVDYVELVIRRGRDGRGEIMLETRAQGGEFWSFFVDTSDTSIWRDGVYTVTAWGTDTNGLSGISNAFPARKHKKHEVVWNLDRKKPEISVSSHELGALVNGRVSISGSIRDGNGIEELSYSTDDGNRYHNVKLRYDRRNDAYNFDIPIDTKIFEDGPAVIQFRARDSMNSEGALSFLIFANNTGPDVQILYPESDEVVNGIFTVAGYAMHNVGLRSLTWRLGKASGEIPLIVGNPWWVQEFDIRGQNVKNLDLEIIATDLSGNVTTAKRRLNVDQNADLPTVTINQPLSGAVLPTPRLMLVGRASDNDGVASIFYAIGNNPPVEVPCSGYFQLMIKDIPSGVHNLEVWAKDVTGVIGPKVVVRGIVVPGGEPAPRFTRVLSGSGRNASVRPFNSGIDVNAAIGSNLELVVNSGAVLQTLSYQFGTRAPVVLRGGRAGESSYTIPVPRDIETGQQRLEIKARDASGREVVYEDYIHVLGADGERPSASEAFTWVRPNSSGGGGRMVLTAGEPMKGIYNQGPLATVHVSQQHDSYFNAFIDEGGVVNFTARAGGSYDGVTLTLGTASGQTFRTPAYQFIVDSGPPTLQLVDNIEGRWVQNQIPLRFRISGGNRIRTAEFSVNMGESWQPLLSGDEIARAGANTIFERTLNIASLDDGSVLVKIRLTDEANVVTEEHFSVNKDTVAPVGQLIVPISGSRVNGTIRLGIAIKEAGRLSTVTYQRPQSTGQGGTLPAISTRIYSGEGNMPLTFLDVLLDSTMPLDRLMSFVFTDAAGNSSTLTNFPLVIDNEMDLPVVQISLPLENEVISADFVISGVCFDDDKVKQVYYRFDNGPEHIVEAENGFSIQVPLSSMTDNEHSVTVYAEDIYGVRGRPVTRRFRVSLQEPVASITYPSATDIVGGQVMLTGRAFDRNGISRVQVSFDNGNTYNDASGRENWTYSFNSKIIQDGNHAVFVQVWDNYDIRGMYSFLINVDNTPPELVLHTPTDGAETTGPLFFTGQVMDSMGLESVKIKLNSLDGVRIPPALAEKTAKLDALLLDELDISSLPDGNYNVEVWATDKANNISRAARNVSLLKGGQRNFVDVLFPLNGQSMQGNFDIYGSVGGLDKASHVTLLINGTEAMVEQVSEAGYYRFNITPGKFNPGENRFTVRSSFGRGGVIESQPRTVQYKADGPWVTVDTISMGDFAYERPWLFGRAGYELTEEDLAILRDRKADKEARAAVAGKKLSMVELSFNNGLTFFATSKSRERNSNWRYRLETQDMTEGLHYMIVRATMVNGEQAITRILIQVDKTSPVIRLINPEPGERYNQELEFAALISDDVELRNVSYHLRRGDKNRYEVPGFIKGLYLDFAIPPVIKMAWNEAPSVFAGGATFFDVGFGLSFFGDNVKLQLQYGQMTQDQFEMLGGSDKVRYGGHVLGLKLLANVYTLPFDSFLGPDWEWLSASFALGANFSFFDLAQEGYTQSGQRTWLSAMLIQLEFPKITIPRMAAFRTFSLFTEGQLWFVPTDLKTDMSGASTIIPKIILGFRIYIF